MFRVLVVVRFCRGIVRVEVAGLMMLSTVGVKVPLVRLLRAVVIVVLRRRHAPVVVEASGQLVVVVPQRGSVVQVRLLLVRVSLSTLIVEGLKVD